MRRGNPLVGLLPLALVALLLYFVHGVPVASSAGSHAHAPASAAAVASQKPVKPGPRKTASPRPSKHGSSPACTVEEASLENIPEPYRALFLRAAHRFDTSALMLAALYLTENGNRWKPFGSRWPTSQASASGPMQFIPGTWEAYKQDGNGDGRLDVNNMEDAVYTAANMMHQYGIRPNSPTGSRARPLQPGSMLRVAASYNAGPNAVRNWGPNASLSALYPETRNYVSNVDVLFRSRFTRSGHPYYADPIPAGGHHRCT